MDEKKKKLKKEGEAITALPWSLGLLGLGQQGRPRNETQTAKQREENTIWTTQVTIRGTQRIRVVLWGGMEVQG